MGIQWTDDCQGKKDYDGAVVRVSSRYWPAGGGFSMYDTATGRWQEGAEGIKPSAVSTILLFDEEIARREFDGETPEEVFAQVEAWVMDQVERVTSAVRRSFEAKS